MCQDTGVGSLLPLMYRATAVTLAMGLLSYSRLGNDEGQTLVISEQFICFPFLVGWQRDSALSPDSLPRYLHLPGLGWAHHVLPLRVHMSRKLL